VLGEKPPRWDTVGCHIGVTRSGKVIWLHDFNRLVVHGNGWNTQTVGIEIDGLYAGVEGDPKTVWDDPSTTKKEVGSILTQESIDATQQVIRFIADEIEKNGGKLKAIVAHRQASENRRNDPGSAIWKAIALPMAKELETSDGGPGFKLSKGYAIPESWDPSRKGIKY
jgi:N-acetyl-anhydromuramyl-L-alanine amidase AmpD